MPAEFTTIEWDDRTVADCRSLVQLALQEDLAGDVDLTTHSLVADSRQGRAVFVAREAGVVCGLQVAAIVREVAGASFDWQAVKSDGDAIQPGDCVATIVGSAQELLTCERTILNFLGRMSGIATLTSRYVEQVAGTKARVYDTRKTTPGWRRLEKYATRRGGGCNHRTGLFDAVLIKDNHLALSDQDDLSPGEAVARARQWLTRRDELRGEARQTIVEVEVDTLDQLRDVLPANPDIVLLDNMTNDQLCEAISLRKGAHSTAVLEASGGVNLDTIGAIALTGVDRISVGALTHSARTLDIGLDWRK